MDYFDDGSLEDINDAVESGIFDLENPDDKKQVGILKLAADIGYMNLSYRQQWIYDKASPKIEYMRKERAIESGNWGELLHMILEEGPTEP